MKNLKLIFILPFLCFYLQSQAQPNHFFPMENGIWEEAFIGFTGTPITTYVVTCGDTIINNELHAKLYEVTLNPMGVEVNRAYKGASKTGADIVNFIPKDSLNAIVLYDFSLETGQTIDLEILIYGETMTYTVIGNSLMSDNAGITRRVITLEISSFTEVWIEGIGSNWGVLNRGLPPAVDFETYMNCFKYEDILLWSNEATMPACEATLFEICGTTSIEDFSFFDKV